MATYNFVSKGELNGKNRSGAFLFVGCTRVIFYVRRIGLYLFKYRIYGTITIYSLKGLAPVYHLI